MSGVFNSLGAITRAVYSILRNIGSFEAGEERLKDPQNICSGLFVYGLGGCFAEFFEGLGNCCSKPCKKTKPGGPGCCGRTLSGCLNLVCSPATGAIRWVNQFATGTANCFKKPAPENVRTRYPRQFGVMDEMTPYDAHAAMAENALHVDEKRCEEKMAYYKWINELTVLVMTRQKEGLKAKDIIVYRKDRCKYAFPVESVKAFETYDEFESRHSLNIVTDKKKIELSSAFEAPLKEIQEAIREHSGKEISEEKK